jgi:hypothetical protein
MTKKKTKNGNANNIFSKDLAYRFSTLLVVAGCYLIMRFVITDANVIPLVKPINILLFCIKKALSKEA